MEQKGEKFCRNLEALVKCPICHERLSGDIAMCETGHSVCRGCTFNGLQRCAFGTCRKPYTATKNVLAQELLLQLDGLKVCLMELDASKFKLNHEKLGEQSANSKDELQPGQYRCWLTNDCKFIGYSSAIYEHCKNIHPLEFDEYPNGSLPHSQNWQMNYFTGNNLNRAFNIATVGVFVLHISKTENEEMRACIFMYAPSGIAYQYSYKIEIECDDKKLSYNGQVDSARIPKHIVLRSGRKGLFIDCNEPLYHALKEKLRFKCSITIEKTNPNETDGTNLINTNNQENQQRKKRGNNHPTAFMDEKEKNSDETSVTKDGKYRCWITDQCSFSADVSTMVQHFKNVHVHHFDEFLIGNLPFQKTWEMNYFIGKNFDRAIKIRGLVFIVHISINNKGEFGACVLMYTSDTIADQHSCQIEVECDQQKLCYTKSKVISAKSPEYVIIGFRQSGLQIARNKLMYNALKENELFKCTVLIQRLNESAVTGKKPMKQIRKNVPKYRDTKKNVDALEIINNSNDEISQTGIVNKQSAGPKSSTQFRRDQSVPRNQTHNPPNESNNFTMPPKITTALSYTNNQLPQSKQLYPDLAPHGVAQGPPVNFAPTPVRHEMIYQRNANIYEAPPMINSHFNSSNLPGASAPYERPPPTNPHFQQQTQEQSTRNSRQTGNKSAQKKKEDDACVLS